MYIIKNKKIFFIISGALVVLSLISIFSFGLKIGIDFKGGSLTEVEYQAGRPEQKVVEDQVKKLSLGEVIVQPLGTIGYSIKTRAVSDTERQAILGSLGTDATEKSFTSIGPSVGAELVRKSILLFILVSISIILFIAFSFRKVSMPVSSWRYGWITIVTLIHDIIIPVGAFAVLSHFYGAEVDTLFVIAVLTILGISINDKIVVFDRVRENLKGFNSKSNELFSQIVGKSITQTITRSINTSATVIFVLLALYFFGPASTKYFALMLTAGMFFGTYSSIFLASPMLVWVEEMQSRKK